MWTRDRRRLSGRFGIRLRVVTAATVVVGITLAASGVVLVGLMQQALLSNLDAEQLAQAQAVAAQVNAGPANGVVRSTATESSAVQVIDAAGNVFASTANLEGEVPMSPQPPIQRRTTTVTVSDSPLDNSSGVRVTMEPIVVHGGPGWVYVASSLAQVDAAARSLTTLFSIGVPLIGIVVALIAALAVRRALKPVEEIRRRTEAIGAAGLSQRVPVPAGDDEIAHLATTMNRMLARLELTATRQEQFVGDASHELRGPLTALQTQIDVALSHPGAPDTAQALPKMREQVTRMGMLIEDLLFLARSEDAAAMVLPAPVDLDELILAEAHRLEELGSLTIRVHPLQAARVRGSTRDLTRMLRNLGDNAHDHARSTVTLGLTTDSGMAQITVSDDGPGIDVEDRERIFARFSRLDDARARNSRGGGSGLGLSIARTIAIACGGTVTVHDRPDGGEGAVFVARFPLSE